MTNVKVNNNANAEELSKTKSTISLTMSDWLLDVLDVVAAKKDVRRAHLIDRAVKKYVLMSMDHPDNWDTLIKSGKIVW